MKRLCALICLLMMLSLLSCFKDESNKAKEEFGKYHSGNEVVLIVDDKNFYFDTHTVKLSELVNGEEPNGGYFIKNEKIYFSTSKELHSAQQLTSYSLCIYECDLFGKNLKLIYERDGYATHPWSTVSNGIFYIEHNTKHAFAESCEMIDSYDVVTGEYANVGYGEGGDLSKYVEERNVLSVEENYFEIPVDNISKRIIDNEYIQSTVYAESINKFGFYPKHLVEKDGRYLLVCDLNASSFNDVYLILEYSIKSDELIYRSVVITYNSIHLDYQFIK